MKMKNFEIAKEIVEWAAGQLFIAESCLNDDVSEAKNAINFKPSKDFDDELVEYENYYTMSGVGMNYLSVVEDNRFYEIIKEIMNSDLPEKPNANQPEEFQKLETTKQSLIHDLLKHLTYAAQNEGIILGVRNMYESLETGEGSSGLRIAIYDIKSKKLNAR